MFDTIKGVNVKDVNVRFLQFIQRLNLAVTLRSGLAQSAANLTGFLVTSRTPDTIDIRYSCYFKTRINLKVALYGAER